METEKSEQDVPAPAEQESLDPLRKEMQQIITVSEDILKQLHEITSHRLMTAFSSTKKILLLQFLRGTAFGLGSVVGATIIVYILVAILSQVEFIPVVGDWIQRLLEEIQG